MTLHFVLLDDVTWRITLSLSLSLSLACYALAMHSSSQKSDPYLYSLANNNQRHEKFNFADFLVQVYLAMEAGYMEKVDELCQRYSLEGYVNSLGKLTPSNVGSYVSRDIFCQQPFIFVVVN